MMAVGLFPGMTLLPAHMNEAAVAPAALARTTPAPNGPMSPAWGHVLFNVDAMVMRARARRHDQTIDRLPGAGSRHHGGCRLIVHLREIECVRPTVLARSRSMMGRTADLILRLGT